MKCFNFSVGRDGGGRGEFGQGGCAKTNPFPTAISATNPVFKNFCRLNNFNVLFVVGLFFTALF